jgi:hypothetical protein
VDNEVAPRLLPKLPPALRCLLGDTSYDDAALREQCAAAGYWLVTTQGGMDPHQDDGVEARRLFHQLRSQSIENFNEQFKAIFDTHGQVPTRGLVATQGWVLGAVLGYQVVLLYRYQLGADLRVGLKILPESRAKVYDRASASYGACLSTPSERVRAYNERGIR